MKKCILSFDPAIVNLGWSKLYISGNKDYVSIDDATFGLMNLEKICCDESNCCESAIFNFELLSFSCCKNHADILNLPKNKSKKIGKHPPFSILAKNLIKILNSILIDDVDVVLIENQPSLVNPKAKSVSLILYTYYIMKNKNVIFVSPDSKILDINNDNEKKKIKYSERKKLSIKRASEYLSDELKSKLFDNFSRSADITDSICQAIFYFKKISP